MILPPSDTESEKEGEIVLDDDCSVADEPEAFLLGVWVLMLDEGKNYPDA